MEHWGISTLKRQAEEECEIDGKPGEHGNMEAKSRPFKK